MRTAYPATLLLLLAACSAGDGRVAGGWRMVTDAVGDTMVVRTVGVTDQQTLARLVPELRIGEVDGPDEYQFADVVIIRPAPGGGVYTWDQTITQLRRYDSTGRYVRDVGRKGGGPGEYEYLNGVGVLPDGRVLTWDPRLQRVNVYDTAGAPVAVWRAPAQLIMMDGLTVDTAGNVYLFDLLDPWDPRNPEARRRGGYIRLAAGDRDRRDTLFLPEVGVEARMLTASAVANGSSTMAATSLPFAPEPFRILGPAGYFITARGDRYAITLHRPEGPLRIERDLAATRVDPDERANAEERAVAMLRRLDPAWKWSGPPIPDTKPFIKELMVGDDGRIWVGRSMPGERIPAAELADATRGGGGGGGPSKAPPRRWREPDAFDVYAPDGRYLGFLPIPERTQLLYRDGDRVWGVVRDSLDVPYVTRFRIEWAR